MARRILVVPATNGAGVTAACLGLAQALRSRRAAVAFAKPFAQERGYGEDQSTELFRLTMALRPPQPLPASDIAAGLGTARAVTAMGQAIALTAELDESNRVLVLEGLAATTEQPAAAQINLELAQAYDAQVVLVASAENADPEQLAERVAAMERSFTVRGEQRVIGVVVNRVPADVDRDAYLRSLADRGLPVVACVEARPELTRRRVSDLVRELGLEVVRDGELGRRVASTTIVAQTAPAFLSSLEPERLLIVPGDRHEVLMGAALAEAGGTRLAAVLLTGGIAPDPAVLELCEAAAPSRLPILASTERTFETTQRVLALSNEVPADDEERAMALTQTFADAYDDEWLDGLPHRTRPARITPAQFVRRATAHAGVGITRIAIADGTDPRVLRAVCRLEDVPNIQCFLVADPDDVDAAAETHGLDVPPLVRIVDPARPGEHIAEAAAEVARSIGQGVAATDPLVVALALQSAGEVDGVVGGMDRSRTFLADAVRAFVQRRSDVSSVSASQFVEMPDEVLVYADTMVNPEPTAEELVSIAALTADTATLFGLEPRIAFIRPSSSSPRVEEQRQRIVDAMEMLRQQRPDLTARGPVAYGTATKRVPGFVDTGENATVLVFPEIASATATVRVAAGTVGARVHPPLLQGLGKAVNMLGRDATVDDIREVVLATAMQATGLV